MVAGGIRAVSSFGTLNPFLAAILSARPTAEHDLGASKGFGCTEASFEKSFPASASSIFVFMPIFWFSHVQGNPTFPFSVKKSENDFDPNSSFIEFERKALELGFGGGRSSIMALLSSVLAMINSILHLIQHKFLQDLSRQIKEKIIFR